MKCSLVARKRDGVVPIVHINVAPLRPVCPSMSLCAASGCVTWCRDRARRMPAPAADARERAVICIADP